MNLVAKRMGVWFTRPLSGSCLVSLLGAVALFGLLTACQTTPTVPPPRYIAPPGPDDHGMLTPYTLTLRHFADREALAMVQVMAEEFPGYRSHNLIAKTAAVRDYEYLSTAKVFKLEEWLYLLLRHMGFDTERDILIQVDGTHLIVDKLVPSPSRAIPNERRRFL